MAFVQDLNGSRNMDYRFGLPLEPWGTSRDAPIWFGKPAWDDAKFEVPGPPVTSTAR